jgi:crotonobetainyl-CoA:carnitine CoA-transferase CaiB-like acyl-CoA transferase
MSALKGIRIIELAEQVAGEYCGKLLADFEAEIIKIEPLGGSPTRHMAPLTGQGGREAGGVFSYLNTNKRSVVLDLTSKADIATLHELISTADAVIDDHDREWLKHLRLSPEDVAREHATTVFCSITPYGIDAPPERWNAQALNVFHSSGWGYHTPTLFDPAMPPLKGPGRFLVDFEAAIDAALCVVSALYWRKHSDQGQSIDICSLEVQLSRADTLVGRFLTGEDNASSSRAAFNQGGPQTFYRCADGHVYLYMTTKKHWNALRTLMGDPEWARAFREDWLEFAVTDDAIAECRRGFGEWVRPMLKDDVSANAQKLGLPLVPVNDITDLLRSPQYAYRQFFKNLPHPTLGQIAYPTVPYQLSATPAQLLTAAPAPGADTAAVLSALRSSKPKAVPSAAAAAAPKTARGPLAGVRVLALTKVWAGPYAGKLLAFLGAEVVKVESYTNLDEMRAYGGTDIDHAPYFLSLNPEIVSVQVNLKTEAGIAKLKELVAKSDIVMNNLRPGAIERLGFSFEKLKEIKPDIISMSIKMWGNDGPLGYQTGYAPSFSALGGLNALVGYEGGEPLGINMRYGDSTVGANAAFAAVVALLARERTGEGQFVDVSAVECMSAMVGDSLFNYSVTGRVPGPDGNVHADMAPHGCYPCGEDWIAIAIASDEEWQKLCAALAASDLARNPEYQNLAGRQAHRQDIDAALSRLTRGQDAVQLAERLCAAGVAACKSQNSYDIINDRSLWDRRFYRLVSDARDGKRPIVGAPWRFSKTPFEIERGAPRLGEHNAYVYGEILGYSPKEIEQLIRDQVIH